MLLGNKTKYKLFSNICRTIIYVSFNLNSQNEPKTIIFKIFQTDIFQMPQNPWLYFL
jgi:hypothetical protein